MGGRRYNDRIMIQRLSGDQDADGGAKQTWVDVTPVWADVEVVGGREYFGAQANQNPVQTKIWIRQRPGILPSMRAVHGDIHYSIDAALPQKCRELLLMCTSGVADG